MWKMSTRNALKANWNFINCKIIAFDWCITMLVKSWEWNRPVPVSAAHSRPSQTRSETKLFRSAFARDDQFGNGVKYRSESFYPGEFACQHLNEVFFNPRLPFEMNWRRCSQTLTGRKTYICCDIFSFLLQLISDIVRFCFPSINMKLD